MSLNDSETAQEKPPERERKMSFNQERKLSFERERKLSAEYSAEPRLRTRSFSNKGKTNVIREYVGDKMDKQLEQLNLVKKNMPMDPSSIFRAVCEQVSSVQTDHVKLRMFVEDMLKDIARGQYKFGEPLVFDREKTIFEILSNLTGSRIKVYRNTLDEPEVFEAEDIENDREIQVCETRNRGCFDSVYSGEMHEALAISQSIVYSMLYEGVFEKDKEEIKEMVDYIRKDMDEHAQMTLDMPGFASMGLMSDNHMHSTNPLCASKPPKFPYCACKSLAPEIYRNVEYSLSKKKVDESAQAAQNSLAVKFGVGARCQARDGGITRNATVIRVVMRDVRCVQFDEMPRLFREFNVSDLRPLASQPVMYPSMQNLMNGTGGRAGGGQQMAFLPGCMPPTSMSLAPPFPGHFGPPFQPPAYGMPPPPFGRPPMSPHNLQLPPLMGALPPPSPPVFSPLFNNSQPHFFPGADMQPPRPQPPKPKPVEKERSGSDSSCANAVSSSLDTSVFISTTPLSSKKSEDGRRNKKPRALSADLTDSPTTTARSHKWEPTWNKPKLALKHKDEGEHRKGGRRATEGDTVGEMNRPLRPKQHRLSTCDTVPENDTATLPSLMGTPTQQLQQLQLNNGAATTGPAVRSNKLPLLLPQQSALQHSSYYESSEFMGSDTVFKEGEDSQTNLVNTVAALPMVHVPVVPMVPQDKTEVPHISQKEFENEVNKNVDFSQDKEGKDLPDTMTTRFFYNLGVLHFKQNIEPPPPDAVPMPPAFTVPPSPLAMPPPSPAFYSSANVPFTAYQPSAAPPNTPWLAGGPASNLPPHLMQYAHPGVEGMPFYNGGFMDDGRGGGGGQMMDGGQMNAAPSPSPMMNNGSGGNYFNYNFPQ